VCFEIESSIEAGIKSVLEQIGNNPRKIPTDKDSMKWIWQVSFRQNIMKCPGNQTKNFLTNSNWPRAACCLLFVVRCLFVVHFVGKRLRFMARLASQFCGCLMLATFKFLNNNTRLCHVCTTLSSWVFEFHQKFKESCKRHFAYWRCV